MSEIGGVAGGEAARQAAIEAAKRAAEAAAKAAAEAAAKRAAEQAAKQAAQNKPAPTRDQSAVTGSADRIEATAKAPESDSPWNFTKGLSSVIELGGALGAAAQKGLANMQQAEQARTQAFVDKASGQLSDAGAQTLERLQANGRLDARDSSGSNVRDQLDSFLREGGDPAMAEGIMQQIANPVGEIRQLRDETCVAANNMQAMAQQNPAEYFRMAAELGTSGRTTFPDGQKLELSPETQAYVEKASGSPAERASAAMQAALMEFANGARDYNMASDTSSGSIDLPFIGDISLGSQQGLSIEQAQSLQDALGTSPTFDPRSLADASDQKRGDALQSAIDSARGDGFMGVQVPMHADGGGDAYHMVEVRGMEGDTVKLYDVVQQRVYPMDRQDFMDNVGWDITADDDIGALRGKASGGGGLGDLGG